MKLDQLIATTQTKKVYLDGDSVIKLFNKSTKASDVLNEALNQARVSETDVAMPKIQAVTMVDGQWAIVMDYIKGKTLRELMHEHPEKIDEYLERFVDLQLSMHAHTVPLLTKLKDKMSRKISEAELSATNRYELNMRLEGMPKHNKLCHGDYNPSNVIIGEDGVDYIIDWSHATQGNASADAARTYLMFYLKDSEELAEKYLKLFCKKSDTAKQYVMKWFPIVAASQSVKGNPEEREFLLRWADIVDYE